VLVISWLVFWSVSWLAKRNAVIEAQDRLPFPALIGFQGERKRLSSTFVCLNGKKTEGFNAERH